MSSNEDVGAFSFFVSLKAQIDICKGEYNSHGALTNDVEP